MFLQNEQCAISTATSANRFYTSARNLPASLNWLNKKADIDTPSPADFKDRLYTIRFGRSILRVVSNRDMIREVAEGDGSFGFIGTDYTDNWRLGPRPRCDLTKQVAMLAFERLLTLEPKMQLFIPKTETFDPKNRLDVVTSYPNSLIKFMLEQSLPLGEVKVVGGKVEGYVGLDDINAGFDIVESGGTLRTNGLWVPNEFKDTGIEIVLLGIWRKLNQKV